MRKTVVRAACGSGRARGGFSQTLQRGRPLADGLRFRALRDGMRKAVDQVQCRDCNARSVIVQSPSITGITPTPTSSETYALQFVYRPPPETKASQNRINAAAVTCFSVRSAANSKELQMSRKFAAILRQANPFLRPARVKKATKSFQKAMAGLLVASTMAPLIAVKPKTTKPRKAVMPKADRSLGAVLRQLHAVQSLLPGTTAGSALRPASPRIPKGAKFLGRTHRSAKGSRNYKIYLPASHPKRPTGLILMMHGCHQTPDDFALGTNMNALAEKHGLVVAYPAQSTSQNAASCWNWFKPGNQIRGAGEPAILASLARKLTKEFDLDRGSVFVAGLSAGGAMAAILADVYPDVFSAAGVHSGLARGAANGMSSAILAMRNGGATYNRMADTSGHSHRVRRIVFQGDADSTVHPSNAAMIVAAAVGDDVTPTRTLARSFRGRGYVRSDFTGPDGRVLLELWMLDGAGHNWSGGRPTGSYTDKSGPDASAQMVRFFLEQPS